MSKKALLITLILIVSLVSIGFADQMDDYFNAPYGKLLPGSTEHVGLWWTYSGWKISQNKAMPTEKSDAILIRAARNESDAAQLVVCPQYSLCEFMATSDKLTGPDGTSIPANNIDVLQVRYVETRQPTDDSTKAGLWPEPLPPFKKPIHLVTYKNQPLWIRVEVPKDAKAGLYKGTIKLTAKNYNAEVPLHVEVYDFTMPDKMTCRTALGFDYKLAFKYHKAEYDWQKRMVMEHYWATFSSHRISPFYDPDPYHKLKVTWPEITEDTKPEDIKPVFDWTEWDKGMEEAINTYHFDAFRIFIPGMGGGHFPNRTEPNLLGFTGDTPEYKAALASYCEQVETHLKEKGWIDMCYIYWFDEPTPKDYDFIMNGFNKLKESAPGIKRLLTHAPVPELFGGPNLWVPHSFLYEEDVAVSRQKLGEEMWWYLCAHPLPPYATLFLDHPATNMRVWVWQTWERNIEGLLIWTVNWWDSAYQSPPWDQGRAYPDPNHPQNPYEDTLSWQVGRAKTKTWGNGDGVFIYPPEAAAAACQDDFCPDQPVDSIRWEMLRDGLEDYEYMVILKKLIEEKRDKLSMDQHKAYMALLEIPESVTKDMKNFTKDPEPIEIQRDKIARAIAEISNL